MFDERIKHLRKLQAKVYPSDRASPTRAFGTSKQLLRHQPAVPACTCASSDDEFSVTKLKAQPLPGGLDKRFFQAPQLPVGTRAESRSGYWKQGKSRQYI